MNTGATESFHSTRWTLVRPATGLGAQATLTEAAVALVAESKSGDKVLRNVPARCLIWDEHAPMKTNILLCGVLAAMLTAPFVGYAAAQGSPAGEKPKRTADEQWSPPRGAHVGGNDFSTFCIHDGKDATFVIAYHGDFDSTSRSSSNAKARTWNNDVTLTAKKPGIALNFYRTHTAPGKLGIAVTPAEDLDLSKPAPPPRNFGQKEYDLAKGRVFLLTDSGTVRQFDHHSL